jgi:hypothetical protein
MGWLFAAVPRPRGFGVLGGLLSRDDGARSHAGSLQHYNDLVVGGASKAEKAVAAEGTQIS